MTNTPADQLLQEVKLPGFLGDSNPPWESMSTSTQSWPPGVSLEVLEEARVGGLRFIGSLQSIMILPIGIFLFRGIPHFQTDPSKKCKEHCLVVHNISRTFAVDG